MAKASNGSVALGFELDWIEEEIDKFLEVRPEDFILAQQLVEESVARPFLSILFAEDEDAT